MCQSVKGGNMLVSRQKKCCIWLVTAPQNSVAELN